MPSEKAPWFGELYTELMQYEGQAVSKDILVPWLPQARLVLDALQHYRKPNSPQNEYKVESEDLWQWYAPKPG